MLSNKNFTGLKKDVCIDNDMIYHTCQGTVGASAALAEEAGAQDCPELVRHTNHTYAGLDILTSHQ